MTVAVAAEAAVGGSAGDRERFFCFLITDAAAAAEGAADTFAPFRFFTFGKGGSGDEERVGDEASRGATTTVVGEASSGATTTAVGELSRGATTTVFESGGNASIGWYHDGVRRQCSS